MASMQNNLAKVGVEGSNPFARSNFLLRVFHDPNRSLKA